MKRVCIATLLAAVMAGLCACRIPPVRRVNLRAVEEQPDGSPGRPIVGAHLRAIPMGTGPVPLPVSRATLEQSKWAKDATASTDKNGRARLKVYKKASHLVEIGGPVRNGEAEIIGEGPWAWMLSVDGRVLTPAPRNGATEQPGVLLLLETGR